MLSVETRDTVCRTLCRTLLTQAKLTFPPRASYSDKPVTDHHSLGSKGVTENIRNHKCFGDVLETLRT